MDDVAALCDRVLIINHGRLFFDGALADLVRRTRPEKRLTLHLGAAVGSATLAGLGRIIESSERQTVIQVSQGALRATIERALGELPVADLTVEDAPLEEVLADVFASTASSGGNAP
jgi:ABC-2 type transport system ATP-binding protein